MKKILTIILIISICLTFAGCQNNTTNNHDNQFSESINVDVINALSQTNKIIIKMNNKNLGTITDTTVIGEILDILSNASNNNEIFNCDGHSIDFKMYQNDKLIDTIYVWTHNERVIPASIHKGCSYYYVSQNNKSIKKIIEEQTDFIFYTIYDYTEVCDTSLELIYEDNNYKYYFDCIKSNNVFIKFETSNLKITLKEALNKKYITPSELLKTYPDLLIKKAK